MLAGEGYTWTDDAVTIGGIWCWLGAGLYGGDERGNGNRMEIVLVCRGGERLYRLHTSDRWKKDID